MDGETIKTAEIFGKPAFAGSECKVIKYDFRRPDKFSLEQVRTAAEVHESFARFLSELLSVKLRTSAAVSLKKVDQMTMHEYLSGVSDPACITTARMKPLQGPFLLELHPELRYILTNRLFGGTVDLTGYFPQMTAGEHRLYRDFNSQILEKLNEAWRPIVDLQTEVEDIHSRVKRVDIVPQMEMVLTVFLEVEIDKKCYGINICYPFITIEPLIHKLSIENWFSSFVPADISGRSQNKNDAADLHRIPLRCEISTESAAVPIKKIKQLKKGDLIPLPALDKGILTFTCGSVPLFSLSPKGEKGSVGRYFEITGSRSNYFHIETAAAGRTGENTPAESGGAETERKKMMESLSKISEQLYSLSEAQQLLQDSLFTEKEETAAVFEGLGRQKFFTDVGPAEPDSLFLILQNEHPQITAAVLSRIEAETAAMVLDRLEANSAVDIAGRIASAGRSDQTAIAVLEVYLSERLRTLEESDPASNDGLLSLTSILNVSSRSLEKEIVEGLEKTHTDLAEEIKKRMFVFEDIVMLDEKAISVLVEHADPELFALAMKAVKDDIKEKIYELMEETQADALRRKVRGLGRVRMRDIETAEEEIIELLKHLEESGRIIVGRGNDVVE